MLRLLKLGMFHMSMVRAFHDPKCIILRGVHMQMVPCTAESMLSNVHVPTEHIIKTVHAQRELTRREINIKARQENNCLQLVITCPSTYMYRVQTKSQQNVLWAKNNQGIQYSRHSMSGNLLSSQIHGQICLRKLNPRSGNPCSQCGSSSYPPKRGQRQGTYSHECFILSVGHYSNVSMHIILHVQALNIKKWVYSQVAFK